MLTITTPAAGNGVSPTMLAATAAVGLYGLMICYRHFFPAPEEKKNGDHREKTKNKNEWP